MKNNINFLEKQRKLFISGHYSPQTVKDAQELLRKNSNNEKVQREFHYYPDWESGLAPGASWDKQFKKWRASIKIRGKSIYLGLFDTREEACYAYLKAKREKKGT